MIPMDFEKFRCRIEGDEKLQKYTLRWKNMPWWAVFIITDDGMLFVQSDFGSYSHWWTSMGQPVREFLLSIDNSYLAGKLALGRDDLRVLDVNQTINNLKQNIIEARRETVLDEAAARDLYDDIVSLSKIVYYGTSDDSLYHQFMEYKNLSEHFGFDVPTSKMWDPMLQGFLDNIWPAFRQVLQEELD